MDKVCAAQALYNPDNEDAEPVAIYLKGVMIQCEHMGVPGLCASCSELASLKAARGPVGSKPKEGEQ